MLDSIAKNEEKEESKKIEIREIEDFKIMFIDHLPNAGNGILSQLNSYKIDSDEKYNSMKYSPREYLIKYNESKHRKLIELA